MVIFTPPISSGNDSAEVTTTASALMLIVVIPRLVVYPSRVGCLGLGEGTMGIFPLSKKP